MFDFLVPDVSKLFLDDRGFTMKKGYRFSGTAPSELAARQKDKKRLCDAFNIIGFMCVNLKFKEIVESLEPAVHQFFPIALQATDETRYGEPHFIFNPCTVIDAYLGIADLRWGELSAGKPPFRPYISGFLEGTVSGPEIAGRHVWVGGFQGYQNVHISDELYKRFTKAKVRYLWCVHLDESDAVWRPRSRCRRPCAGWRPIPLTSTR